MQQQAAASPSPEPTNLILYGPPGTGKTYATAREALRLCGEDVSASRYPETEDGRKALMETYNRLLHQDKRIGFVTFHQSYAYEDFVEGLRPRALPGGGFTLVPKDGIFKQMAARAAESIGELPSPQPVAPPPPAPSGADFSLKGRTIYRMSQGQIGTPDGDQIFEEAITSDHALFSYVNIDWSDPRFANPDEIKKALDQAMPDQNIKDKARMTHVFRNKLKIGDILVISMGQEAFRAIGLVEGPYEYAPRSSGTYCHRRKVRWLWHNSKGLSRDELQPDTQFAYKGINRMDPAKIDTGRLLELIAQGQGNVLEPAPAETRSAQQGPLPHVLIIDEINRGNVSKIFGELITLIEPDKRAGMTNALNVTLPYSNHDFTVPANLHIIGTMNTADRSIALLDTALRRRFTFRELEPEPERLNTVGGVDLQALLTTINARIEYLIDREHRIGHAFFMGCTDRAGVDGVMRDKVIPLLQEYFFEDWSRMHAVLGSGFIGSSQLPPPPGLKGEAKPSWFVRWDGEEKAFPANAYDLLLNPGSA